MKAIRQAMLVAAAAAAAATLLAVTGCAGGSSGSADQIRYLISQPGTPQDLASVKADLAEFTKQSGISVKLDSMPTDQMRSVLQTQLRSGNGPDVFAYSPGPGFSGALAKAGLLKDLTSQYNENGWKMYNFAKKQVTEDGKLIGIADQVDEVGLFYNKDLFREAGIAAPANLDELTADAKTLAAKGVIPFAVSDQEGWQGGHLLSMALSSRVGSKGIGELLDGDQSWTSTAVVDSLKTWQEFNDQKLLTPSPAAVTYDNANSLFYSGKAAMLPSGTWLISTIDKTAKFDVGFIPFPSPEGKGIYSTGIGKGLFVSAKSKKDAAVTKFLDYMQTAKHGKWQIEKTSIIPAYAVDTTGLKVSPLFSQVVDDTASIVSGGGDFGENIDVLSTDTFNKAMSDGFQGILTGQTTPVKAAEGMQTAYAQGK